ncbi:SDR family oxidoreductase [Salinibacillus xinjiangensis]|uniref:SDR family NAD(P)-dependent oxidoreductase n=1 Tax=Salinibacillus xinjiangensis TaxID=1229268 RepID=A0A6G1X281_9BACI|nr:SDR family oxidoreductase [Salinibacillus xinjiangensis]MRG85044.1 SDR family NAD(P)-dependent oxidoreductase [Salinibacillus xinjiangensis]
MDLSQLKDKVVVIIGASRGIGRATATMLHEKGTKLVLGSRSTEELQRQFVHETVLTLQLDVSDEESVKQFVTKCTERFGHIDVLINAAGFGTFAPILDSETKDFDHMMSVNLRGTYLSCKYFGQQMKKQQEGQILNLVSIAGSTALPGNGGYSASKFGVLGLTKVLQAELRREGIRITSVLPGSVDSSFWDKVDFDIDKKNMIPTQSIAEHIVFLLCQPKQSVVDEITIMPPMGIL